ncbi:hypothetical protein T4A_813 [Trichinella pseudospiralis]|uniref:Uncharacterized protein n=1 Tax=Trichinella pseudospiralis TaxID=6337 RepID=A0A0V1ENQ5_TRIPS|nr:hypothetical protein T4A_813 [Trichinella pseudospiralis]
MLQQLLIEAYRDLEKRVHNHLCIASTERRVNNLRMLAHPAPRLGCVVSNRELKLTVLPKHQKIVDQYLTIEYLCRSNNHSSSHETVLPLDIEQQQQQQQQQQKQQQ